MRLMELLFSFPAILLAVILMASLGTSVLNAMIAIGIIFVPGFARLARASTNTVLRQSYIDAARCLGMGDLRIMAREILPNIVAPSLVEAAVAFAYAVLLESALSFLGLGAQPPEPSWGNMLSTGRGLHGAGALARHRPRPRHVPVRARLQPPGRRVARPARPASAGVSGVTTPALEVRDLTVEATARGRRLRLVDRREPRPSARARSWA